MKGDTVGHIDQPSDHTMDMTTRPTTNEDTHLPHKEFSRSMKGEGAELNEGTSTTLLLESRTQYPQGMQALYSTHFGEAVPARRGQLQNRGVIR